MIKRPRYYDAFQVKTISLILFLLFGLSNLSAQITLGIRTGITNSWRANITSDNDDQYIHHLNLHGSILCYKRISNTLLIGIEPGFVGRATGFDFFDDVGDRSSEPLYPQYFELPLLVMAEFPLWNQHWKLSCKTGYEIAILTNTDDLPGSFVNQLDHGIYSGIGIGRALKRGKLFAEASYYIGFRDVLFFQISKNRSILYSIGYHFSL